MRSGPERIISPQKALQVLSCPFETLAARNMLSLHKITIKFENVPTACLATAIRCILSVFLSVSEQNEGVLEYSFSLIEF